MRPRIATRTGSENRVAVAGVWTSYGMIVRTR